MVALAPRVINPQDFLRCAVVSVTGTLAAGSLGACRVGPLWIGLVCLAHLMGELGSGKFGGRCGDFMAGVHGKLWCTGCSRPFYHGWH